MSDFKEFYLDTLASIDQSKDTILEQFNITKERMKEIDSKFKSLLNNIQDEIDSESGSMMRVDLWVRTLYNVEPRSLNEVFILGQMVNKFEENNTNVGDGRSKGDDIINSLKMLAADVMLRALKEELNSGDNDKAYEIVEDFVDLLKQ